MKSFRGLLALLGLAAALLVGCGGGTDTEAGPSVPEPLGELRITLDGRPGAENVSILTADERGYFEDAGLFVEISSPISPRRPTQYVAEGAIELGISHQPQVELAQAKGVPVVAVAPVIGAPPPAAMIWLPKSQIEGIPDLKGKTIAIPGLEFQEKMLEAVLARGGLTLDDVHLESVGYELIPALTSGRADAIFGGTTNVEGAALRARGLSPVVTPVERLGIPDYDELVLIARPSFLSKHRDELRGFVAAMNRGTEAVRENPRAAVRLILDQGLQWNPHPNRREVEAEVKATLPLL